MPGNLTLSDEAVVHDVTLPDSSEDPADKSRARTSALLQHNNAHYNTLQPIITSGTPRFSLGKLESTLTSIYIIAADTK